MQKKKFKEKIKLVYREISYAILPFFIFVMVLLVSYFGNQLIYNFGWTKGSNWCEIELDKHIPLIPWFVYFYYLTFPLGIITFFMLAYKDKKVFYNLFLTLVISFAISGIIYAFFQTEFTKPDFTPVTFTDKLVVWTWGSTNPINCFPSQHCFMAFAMIIACVSGKNINKFYRVFTILISIMIIFSTVFIRQHFLLDIFGSLDIMGMVYGIVYISRYGEKKVLKQIAKKDDENGGN